MERTRDWEIPVQNPNSRVIPSWVSLLPLLGLIFPPCLRMWTRWSLKSLLALTSCGSILDPRKIQTRIYCSFFIDRKKWFFIQLVLFNLFSVLSPFHFLSFTAESPCEALSVYDIFGFFFLFYHLPNFHPNLQEVAVSVFLPSINISSISSRT